jgi:hypothetical protein
MTDSRLCCRRYTEQGGIAVTTALYRSVLIRLKPEEHRRLRVAAALQERSMASLARDAVSRIVGETSEKTPFAADPAPAATNGAGETRDGRGRSRGIRETALGIRR